VGAVGSFGEEEEEMKRASLSLVSLLVGVSLVVALTGCGGSANGIELEVLCSTEEEWCQGMQQEFEEDFRLTVEYTRMSSGESLERVRAEQADPQFDIWWGGPIDSYVAARQEGLLQAYDSPNYINLRNQVKFKDPENYWAGVYLGTLGFCTNKDWLEDNPGVEPPRSWDDLLKPEFEGQLMVAHPSTSGTSYTALATVLQLRGEEAGWDYLSDYAGQVRQFTESGAAPAEYVGQGEAAVCVVFSHDIVHQIEDNGLPLELTFPEEGTGYEIGGMGIIKGAKHLAAAQRWFDWALTANAQALGPKYTAYQAPTVEGVELSHPELLDVNLIDYDFQWAGEHKTEFIDKFTNEIAAADNLRQ
jgi:iron(III) transport system substrate-binding protein